MIRKMRQVKTRISVCPFDRANDYLSQNLDIVSWCAEEVGIADEQNHLIKMVEVGIYLFKAPYTQ